MTQRFPRNIIPGPPASGLGRLGITYDVGDAVMVQGTPPQDYAVSLETIAPNITTLVEANRGEAESWLDALTRLLPAIAATEQQRQLLKVQTERARMGLPPLDTSDYGLGVRVGLSEDSKQLLVYGGIALLAVLGLGLLRRR